VLFNSYTFLFLLLPLILCGYYLLVPRRWRSAWLVLCSYVFYGWWDWRFCGLLLLTTTIDYLAGGRVAASSSPAARRRWLAFSVCCDLGILGFFKYFDLGAETANALARALFGPTAPSLPLLHLILPVGISFYTFQSMSYTIDIYRGQARPARSFLDFACYVSLFPQLVAGPIVRYRDMDDQLRSRTHTAAKAGAGIALFVLGLSKKVLVADAVAPLADAAFAQTAPGLAAAWPGLLAYTLQIYFDFSGYSDMAVGLGLLLGFRFPQNFDSPYKAVSITDFWRRWHISLSTWLRDYLYIPLGGNRRGPARTYFNLWLTMLLGGLWHGADWTFLAWGAWHGAWLALERMRGKRSLATALPVPVQTAWTFLLVALGWVFFRAPTFAAALRYFAGLAGCNGTGVLPTPTETTALPWIALALAALLAFHAPNTWQLALRPTWRLAAALVFLFALCVATILVNSSSPFLYFQF
jgi:alginate O-acetyltransferase complex protein AlgI